MCINIETLLNKITFADCFNIMQQLSDKCIDIVFTDPPYGKKCDGSSYKFGVAPKKYNKESWDQKIPDKKVFDEIFRVSKNQIIFGGNYFTEYLPPTNSWFVWDKIGNINVKNNFSQAELLWTSYSFAMQKITFIQQGFIHDDPAENKYRFHPTQKPLKLIENILLRLIEKKLINKNSIIADFYSGSATIAAACYNLNLSFIAVENNAEYYKLSCKRLEDMRLQQKLDLWGCLMIDVNLKDIKQFRKNLENTAVDAYPETVRATLDREAFLGLEQYKKNINAKFVIRNKGYLKSLRYQKCGSSLKVNKMVAKTGQSARTFGKVTDGFEKQELGLPIIANKKHIAKALKTARGGNYKKLVAKKNTLQNINNVKTIKDLVKNPAKTAEEQFKQAIGVAHHAHKLVNFLPKKSERGQSIIQIEPKKSGKINKTAKYLYSLKGRVQLLKRVPTLEPAAKLAGSKGGEVFIHEAKRRLFKELSKNLQKC